MYISNKAIKQIKALGLKFKRLDGGFRIDGFFELGIDHKVVYEMLKSDGVTGWIAPTNNSIEFVYM